MSKIENTNLNIIEIQVLEKNNSHSVGIYLVDENVCIDSVNKAFVDKFIKDNDIKTIKKTENSITFSSTATFGDSSQTTVTFENDYIKISGYGFVDNRDYANFLTSNGFKAVNPKKIGIKNNFY